MNKIKTFILFAILAFAGNQSNKIFAMEQVKIAKIETQTDNIPNPSLNINPTDNSWKSFIGRLFLKATIVGLVSIIINPEILKAIASAVNRKYAQELQLKKLMLINESLKTQLEHLKTNCRDRKIIRAMEETYLKSCLQVMELQKKYLGRYAN